jgi:hypothetical protein
MGLPQPTPLGLGLWENGFPEIGFILARGRGGSLKRLHRPNRSRDWLHGFKGRNLRSRFLRALRPFALKAGLMKTRKGFTPVTGKKKMGVGKEAGRLDIFDC